MVVKKYKGIQKEKAGAVVVPAFYFQPTLSLRITDSFAFRIDVSQNLMWDRSLLSQSARKMIRALKKGGIDYRVKTSLVSDLRSDS